MIWRCWWLEYVLIVMSGIWRWMKVETGTRKGWSGRQKAKPPDSSCRVRTQSMTRAQVSATATKQPALQRVECVVTPRSSSRNRGSVLVSFISACSHSVIISRRSCRWWSTSSSRRSLLFPPAVSLTPTSCHSSGLFRCSHRYFLSPGRLALKPNLRRLWSAPEFL